MKTMKSRHHEANQAKMPPMLKIEKGVKERLFKEITA